MASHDVVAFWLLSQEVAKHVKVVQSGRGADEVFAGYHWFADLAGAPPSDAAGAYLAAFRDRQHADLAAIVERDHLLGRDVSAALVAASMAEPGAGSALDRALRFEVEVMLVDDPLKRVDTMTMDASLEARVPFLDHDLVELAAACPDELKLADGGKGILKELGRKRLPTAVVDRPKGYFPVPGVTHLGPDAVDRLRDVLCAPEARGRGLLRRPFVDRLLADPNGAHVPTGGNVLWNVGLLEWWLQEHVDP
jgi:asparagine synthase (glutamine-hydrolysing)